MAFNFNWSPLMADSSFYTRAQDLLTSALNKSPKPPIIVDDIVVNELNLGSQPPDLDILEIGDLAEDRFRGIFKMCYNGDAFLTLKTRVQANPLNTYLSTRPSFASPQPLAAASSLTIPVQITLSEIRLSAFIILVFAKQKGITLVFRNDPLESLKVSSTFDAIPFVRDYLQNEIEKQLRTLLMDEVPAIIHRLSLRLLAPEYKAREEQEETVQHHIGSEATEAVLNPLADPPNDPVDPSGNILNPAQLSSLASDTGADSSSLFFSHRNLTALAVLNDAHNTLSLSTSTMRDVVFRAWAGPTERGENGASITPALTRSQSYTGGTSTKYVFSDGSFNSEPPSSRPILSKYASTASGLSLGSNRSGKGIGGRKRKHRVVDMRKKNKGKDPGSVNDGEYVGEDARTVMTETTSSTGTDYTGPYSAPLEREGELTTPPSSPPQSPRSMKREHRLLTPRQHQQEKWRDPIDLTPRQPSARKFSQAFASAPSPLQPCDRHHDSRQQDKPTHYSSLNPHQPALLPRTQSHSSLPLFTFPPASSSSPRSSSPPPPPDHHRPPPPLHPPSSYLTPEMLSGTILEQAWVMKMASDITHRVEEEKARNKGFWDEEKWRQGRKSDDDGGGGGDDEREPPPAYRA